MATRGAKPKPAALRLVTGTHSTTRHGKKEETKEVIATVQAGFGKLTKPSHVTGQAAVAWKEFIAPAFWLDGSRKAAAIAFCELWKEFRRDPAHFPSSKHGQMRAYMSELGLTDERNRTETGKEEKDEFFGD